MSIMSALTVVVANTVSANVCAGQSQEFIVEPSVVSFSFTGSAAGLSVTCIVGEEIVIDDQVVPPTNRFPIIPDDTMVQAGAFPGDRITVKWRNSTGGNLNGYSRVDIEPA